MKIENERAGILKKIQSGYECFVPHNLNNIEITIDKELNNRLYNAYYLLGKLDGLAITIPDINLFVSMYVQKEAVISSQIEGTQASLVDVLQKDNNKKIKETEEIVNYTKAMNFALQRLNQLPLCNRLIKETHEILLSDVRGNQKLPGEFRRSQNWIGYSGCNLNTASYVPPAPEYMYIALNDLEKYINQKSEIPSLIKIALIHYQFETIHPFLDGNGRIGRLLIILFLKEIGLIEHPVLYLSYFFKKNRSEYYNLLTKVRTSGDFESWIKFFVNGICEISENSINSIQQISNLTNNDIAKIHNLKTGKISNLLKVYEYLLKHPFITSSDIKNIIDVSTPTINKLIETLVQLDILELVENKKRYKQYVYKEYVNILSEGTSL